MNFTPEQREQLRLSLLRYLGGNVSRFGLGAALLLQMARNEGFNADRAAIEAEMNYLCDAEKKLAEPMGKKISPENCAWRITATGRDYLAQITLE